MACALLLGAAASLGGACVVLEPPEFSAVTFRCSPRGGLCPEHYMCCSDDAAAQDGLLPAYKGADGPGFGTPLFSAENNALGTEGMCIAEGAIPPEAGLENGCPLPCNPTWTEDQIHAVCGPASNCCQTELVDPELDCILDPDTGRWRTIRGDDIFTDPQRTDWAEGAHATHQDPGGQGCREFAGGDLEKERSCYRQLSVADQRGYCDSRVCSCVEDPCEMKNPDATPRCPELEP